MSLQKREEAVPILSELTERKLRATRSNDSFLYQQSGNEYLCFYMQEKVSLNTEKHFSDGLPIQK